MKGPQGCVWMSKQKDRLISNLPQHVNRTEYSLTLSHNQAWCRMGEFLQSTLVKEFAKTGLQPCMKHLSSCSCNSESKFGCTNLGGAINDVVRQRSRVNNASSSTSFIFRELSQPPVANLVQSLDNEIQLNTKCTGHSNRRCSQGHLGRLHSKFRNQFPKDRQND